MVRLLDPATIALLRSSPFTYDEVGQTANPTPSTPPTVVRSIVLERHDFDAAAADLMSWRVHGRAGLRVAASSHRVEADSVVVLRFGVGPVGLQAPCRVVYVIDEPRRRGFAYGTLAGHPEAGEESFMLEADPDGTIRFTVTAFSRPASALARIAGPISRAAQRAVTDRYLRALDRF